MSRRYQSRTLWGGFMDGKLDCQAVDTGFGGYGGSEYARMPAVFATKKRARQEYEDVRPVIIQELIQSKR